MAVKQRSGEEKVQEPLLESKSSTESVDSQSNLLFLVTCILGIYGSFLTWAVLQERISTTPYGEDMRVFRASNAVNTVQSTLAFISGYLFLYFNSRSAGGPRILPRNRDLIKSYSIVAFCQTISSPLAFAAMRYVDYITVLLAKSCKLVPVMLVHLLLHRTKFPTYKYIVVAMVTIGVSVFSIYAPQKTSSKAALDLGASDQMWGFAILGLSIFLDGLCNTTQDRMFQKFRNTGEVSGPHMMVILNSLTAVFSFVGVFVSGQLEEVLWFFQHHPSIFRDLFLYGLCGAIGQIFIFLTLEHFGSLVLVTTTVTRKMISMLLSVVIYKHKLTPLQWVGVFLVFGGVAGEAVYKQLKK